jgi:ceramide glucosyltransferase
MFPVHEFVSLIGLALLVLATGYAVVALTAVLLWNARRSATIPPGLPPVTVLKPLCGTESNLYEHLRSFCVQDHGDFQIVFGVSAVADPALAVVERLTAEFPLLPIDVVVDPHEHGSNRKISNLINMVARARHDVLVMADSDIHVNRDYLAAVTAPLLDRKVGLVTCLYRGVPTLRFWSRIGAMYANDWYIPSVLLAHLFGYRGYAFGPTLCLRRHTLEAIGGLEAIASHLADDYRLGELVRRLGLQIVLSPYMVDAQHDEQSFGALVCHELRWMRTTRVLRPRSFRMIFLTFSLPLAALGVLFATVDRVWLVAAWSLFGLTAVARLALHFVQRPGAGLPLLSDCWLLPVRDLLTCWIWCRSFFSYSVTWRGTEFDVGTDGVMRRRS